MLINSTADLPLGEHDSCAVETLGEGRLLLHSVEAVCRRLVKQAAAATGGCTKANVSAMLFHAC